MSDKKGKKYMRVNLDLDEKELFKKLQKKKWINARYPE